MSCPRWVYYVIGGFVVVVIIVAISLIVASQATLENTQVGLNYNKSTRNLNEDKLYEAGRHSIGVANKFIKYQKEVQNMDFSSVKCRTKDGLNVWVSVSFQYKLQIDVKNLVDLNYNFPESSHKDAYVKFCRNVFRDVTAEYKAYDFVTQRAAIQARLNEETGNVLGEYGANVDGFQLLDISFPGDFQETINEAQNARLEIDSVENEKQKALIAREGKIAQANIEKEKKKNEAKQKSSQIETDYQVRSAEIKNRIASKIPAGEKLIESLGMNSENIIQYQWGSSITQLGNKGVRLPVNLEAPNSVQCLSGAGQSC